MKTLVVCSGGLDSVCLAHLIAENFELSGIISFDYGQRHRIELEFAAATADRLRCSFDLVDFNGLRALLSGSALTGDLEVPDGRYEQDNMQATVVPNRNAIMLTVAFGAASARGLANAIGLVPNTGWPPPQGAIALGVLANMRAIMPCSAKASTCAPI